MKVVLHDAVSGLGTRGDIVEVSDGYARNFLIPKGKAVMSSPGTEQQAVAMKKAWEQTNAQDREAAEEMAKQLVSSPIEVSARAGDGGKLFGSINSADVVSAIAEQTNVQLDRKMVVLDDAIRTVGSHMVTVKPHEDVEFPVTVSVIEA